MLLILVHAIDHQLVRVQISSVCWQAADTTHAGFDKVDTLSCLFCINHNSVDVFNWKTYEY